MTMRAELWKTEEEKEFLAKEKYQAPFSTEKGGVKERQLNPRRLIDSFLQKEEESRHSINDLINEMFSLNPEYFKNVPKPKDLVNVSATSTKDRFIIYQDDPESLNLVEDFIDNTFRILKNRESWLNTIPI